MKKACVAIWAIVFMLAFGPVPQAAAAPQKIEDNVLQVIKANKNLAKFAELIAAAGIEAELMQKDMPVTVFAPTNDAVAKISSAVMKKAKAEKDGLKSLVRYHVVGGSIVFSSNINGRKAGPSAANGEILSFDGTGKELMVNDAVIKTPDQAARNGVVHVIDAPLIPLSLDLSAQEKIMEREAAEAEKIEKQIEDVRAKEAQERRKIEEARAKAEAERLKAEAEQAKEEAEKAAEFESKTEEDAPAKDERARRLEEMKATGKVFFKEEKKPSLSVPVVREDMKGAQPVVVPVQQPALKETTAPQTVPLVQPQKPVPPQPSEEKKSLWNKLFGW